MQTFHSCYIQTKTLLSANVMPSVVPMSHSAQLTAPSQLVAAGAEKV